MLKLTKQLLINMLFKVVDQFPVNLDSFMGLQVQIVENQVEIFDERNERSGFLFLVHGLKWALDDPFSDFIVGYAFEHKGVELNQ